jgi:hypothetical protein
MSALYPVAYIDPDDLGAISETKDLTWDQIVAATKDPKTVALPDNATEETIKAAKKYAGGWLPGARFRDDTRKCNENFKDRSILALDFDSGAPDWSRLYGVQYAAHTTFRSELGGLPQKWHVFLPLDRPIGAADYNVCCRVMSRRLGGTADVSAMAASSQMFRPASPNKGLFHHQHGEGQLLAVNELLAAATPEDREVSQHSPGRVPDYTGTDDPRIDPKVAKEKCAEVLKNIRASIAGVADLPVDGRDDRGHGWEMVVTNAAVDVWRLTLTPYSPVYGDENKAFALLKDLVPAPMQADGLSYSLGMKWFAKRSYALDERGPFCVDGAFAAFTDLGDEDDLFGQSDILRHIRDAADSRMVGRWGLLAWTLGRVLLGIDARVLLPPTIGGAAALNLGVALVGHSGQGKSSLAGVSLDLLGPTGDAQSHLVMPLGSGEGITQKYLHTEGRGKSARLVLNTDPRILFVGDEIDGLKATTDRKGSTIMSTLRSAVSGATLGQSNAEATRDRNVPANSYRAVFIVNVQPGRSEWLLNDTDGGAQRFIWMPTNNPTLPEKLPDWPGPLDWTVPSRLRPWEEIENPGEIEDPGEIEWDPYITYPESIADEIRAAHRALVTLGDGEVPSESDLRRSHELLTQLKVATGLAALHGRDSIDLETWGWASLVIEESRRQQTICERIVDENRMAADEARAASEARHQTIVNEEAARAPGQLRNEVWGAVGKHLNGQWVTLNSIKKSVRFGPRRNLVPEVLDAKVAEGVVESREGKAANGKASVQYRRASR